MVVGSRPTQLAKCNLVLDTMEVCMSIEAYDYGKKDGFDEACKKILDWIEENRTGMEFSNDFTMYRDHFRSEHIIKFIESLKPTEE
jgi:hypothetical protein